MKNNNCIFTLLFLFSFSSFAVAQNKFEGIIKIENTNAKAMTATFTLKGQVAMMDSKADDANIKMITDEAAGKKLTIIDKDGKRVAIKKEIDANRYANVKKNYEKGDVNSGTNQVKVTRETKKINGYKCYRITAKDKQYEGEAWVTKQLNVQLEDLFPTIRMNQRAMPRIAKTLENGINGFVMEMTWKNIKTKAVDKMTVSIDEKKIEDSVFDISLDNAEIYDGEKIRNMIKEANGDPEKMKKARELLQQMRMQ